VGQLCAQKRNSSADTAAPVDGSTGAKIVMIWRVHVHSFANTFCASSTVSGITGDCSVSEAVMTRVALAQQAG